MKILTIVGARPQFIKAATVSRAFAKKDSIKEIIIHTGQHFDKNMSDIFFTEMDIPRPNYNLNINSLSHGAMTGRMLEEIEAIILKEQPNALLVYGDTNSTLAGALAAKKLHIQVAHVEAGLRSFNMEMPEEINRILTDRISDILFCPTDIAVANLKKEGFDHYECQIEQVGDVMQDAALFYEPRSASQSSILKDHGLEKNAFLLATIHRAENTNKVEKLSAIVNGLNQLARSFKIVLPLHPRTKNFLEKYGLKLNFQPIAPVGYLDMIQLIANSKMVLTDSGGLQKEAYFFEKFCLTLRDQTEWTELVDHGYNQLAPASVEAIVEGVNYFSAKTFENHSELYGGGKASEKICEILLKSSI